ncbi:hypothetical protein RI054_04g22110 [Pseudoscourfieldia marina]
MASPHFDFDVAAELERELAAVNLDDEEEEDVVELPSSSLDANFSPGFATDDDESISARSPLKLAPYAAQGGATTLQELLADDDDADDDDDTQRDEARQELSKLFEERERHLMSRHEALTTERQNDDDKHTYQTHSADGEEAEEASSSTNDIHEFESWAVQALGAPQLEANDAEFDFAKARASLRSLERDREERRSVVRDEREKKLASIVSAVEQEPTTAQSTHAALAPAPNVDDDDGDGGESVYERRLAEAAAARDEDLRQSMQDLQMLHAITTSTSEADGSPATRESYDAAAMLREQEEQERKREEERERRRLQREALELKVAENEARRHIAASRMARGVRNFLETTARPRRFVATIALQSAARGMFARKHATELREDAKAREAMAAAARAGDRDALKQAASAAVARGLGADAAEALRAYDTAADGALRAFVHATEVEGAAAVAAAEARLAAYASHAVGSSVDSARARFAQRRKIALDELRSLARSAPRSALAPAIEKAKALGVAEEDITSADEEAQRRDNAAEMTMKASVASAEAAFEDDASKDDIQAPFDPLAAEQAAIECERRGLDSLADASRKRIADLRDAASKNLASCMARAQAVVHEFTFAAAKACFSAMKKAAGCCRRLSTDRGALAESSALLSRITAHAESALRVAVMRENAATCSLALSCAIECEADTGVVALAEKELESRREAAATALRTSASSGTFAEYSDAAEEARMLALDDAVAEAETSFADRRNAAVEGMSNALRAAISGEMKWYERYVACIAKGSTKEGALDEVPDAGKTLFQAIDSCARLGLHSQATAASRALDLAHARWRRQQPSTSVDGMLESAKWLYAKADASLAPSVRSACAKHFLWPVAAIERWSRTPQLILAQQAWKRLAASSYELTGAPDEEPIVEEHNANQTHQDTAAANAVEPAEGIPLTQELVASNTSGSPGARTLDLSLEGLDRLHPAVGARGGVGTAGPLATVSGELTSLTLTANRIAQLHGLGHMPVLTRLQTAENMISRLGAALAGCPRLEWLDLTSNRMTSLAQRDALPSSLRYVNLARNRLNRIEAAALRSCAELRVLDVRGNRLTTLVVGEMGNGALLPNLQVLRASDNQLRRLGRCLLGCRHLRLLDVSKNELSAIVPARELAGCVLLETLDARMNHITQLPEFSPLTGCYFPRIEELLMADNRLSDGPNCDAFGSALPNLRTIDISFNQLGGDFNRMRNVLRCFRGARAVETLHFLDQGEMQDPQLARETFERAALFASGLFPRLREVNGSPIEIAARSQLFIANAARSVAFREVWREHVARNVGGTDVSNIIGRILSDQSAAAGDADASSGLWALAGLHGLCRRQRDEATASRRSTRSRASAANADVAVAADYDDDAATRERHAAEHEAFDWTTHAAVPSTSPAYARRFQGALEARATVVQAAYRGMIARRVVARLRAAALERLRSTAATRLQAGARGWAWRRSGALVALRIALAIKKESSATRLQAAFRGHRVRGKVARARAAAVIPSDEDSDEDYGGVDDSFWNNVTGLASLEEELNFLDDAPQEEVKQGVLAGQTSSLHHATVASAYAYPSASSVPAAWEAPPSLAVNDPAGMSPGAGTSAAHAAATAGDSPASQGSPSFPKSSPQDVEAWEEAMQKRAAKREEKLRKAQDEVASDWGFSNPATAEAFLRAKLKKEAPIRRRKVEAKAKDMDWRMKRMQKVRETAPPVHERHPATKEVRPIALAQGEVYRPAPVPSQPSSTKTSPSRALANSVPDNDRWELSSVQSGSSGTREDSFQSQPSRPILDANGRYVYPPAALAAAPGARRSLWAPNERSDRGGGGVATFQSGPPNRKLERRSIARALGNASVASSSTTLSPPRIAGSVAPQHDRNTSRR